jgi:acyl-CoA synthetase (NDP forming)
MSDSFSEIKAIFEHAGERKSLLEVEVYKIFDLMGLNTPKHFVQKSPSDKTDSFADKLPRDKAVVKIVSSQTLHKTEAGGVAIVSKSELENAISKMWNKFPDAEGVMVAEFVSYGAFSLGQELMLGARYDEAFGPIVTLGVGGTHAEEVSRSLKEGYSPSIIPVNMMESDSDWDKFIDESWICRYVLGKVRGSKELAPKTEIKKWLKAFAGVMKEFSPAAGNGWVIDEMEVNPFVISNGKLISLDGVLRFKKTDKKFEPRPIPTSKGINSLLKPQTVAVAGVSENKMNMARIILNNVIGAGFSRENLYILKDFDGEIDGVKCYKSPSDFPKEVDMFVVAIPSQHVPTLLEDTAKSKKVRGVVLISGGMGEKEGSENVKDMVLDVIKNGKKLNPDFSLSGGNSLGIVSNESKVNTLFIEKEKLAHPLGDNPNMAKTAFVSQSGAFVITVLSKLSHLKPIYSVTVGNQMDVTVVDYVNEIVKDDEIKTILVYVEGLKTDDGLRLAKAVKLARKKGKSVVFYKAGRTAIGQKAVMGHTASIAGDYAVVRSALESAGAYVCETFEEFDDMTQITTCYGDLKPKSGNAFILSNAGFETSGMADNIGDKSPILTPKPPSGLGAKLQNCLNEFKLDSIVDVRNPMDITPMGSDKAIIRVLEEVLADDTYDSIVVSMVPLTPTMKTLEKEGLENSIPAKLAELKKKYKKPIVFCVSAGNLYEPYCELAHKNGIAVFRSADRAIRALERFLA